MALSDAKKAQTLINKAADAAEKIQSASVELQEIRTLYNTAGVDPTGTPLVGMSSILRNSIRIGIGFVVLLIAFVIR